jgi:hypothetical protein
LKSIVLQRQETFSKAHMGINKPGRCASARRLHSCGYPLFLFMPRACPIKWQQLLLLSVIQIVFKNI